jgi:hypothetical protein
MGGHDDLGQGAITAWLSAKRDGRGQSWQDGVYWSPLCYDQNRALYSLTPPVKRPTLDSATDLTGPPGINPPPDRPRNHLMLIDSGHYVEMRKIP